MMSRNNILACLLLVLLPWSASAVDLSYLGVSDLLTGSVEGNDVSSDSGASASVVRPPKPPKCWLKALQIFQPKNEHEIQTASKVCEGMAPQHQKALAFELARCHLQDVGRKMMETVVGEQIDDPQDCTISGYDDGDDGDDADANEEKESSFPNLSRCLNGLTDTGVNAYTTFYSSVVSLCNDLTRHLSISFQQHATMELAKISHQTVEIIQRQQEREEELRKKHEQFYADLKEHQDSVREGEASRFEAVQEWTNSLMNRWKAHDQEQKEHHEAWFQNFTNVWENQAAELERQYQKRLASATSFIQPLLSLETWIRFASSGYRLVAILFHGLLVLSAMSLITRPFSVRQTRKILFTMIVLETFAEICLYFMMDGMLSEEHKKQMLASLRPTALCAEVLVYITGVIFSCCCTAWSWLKVDDGMDGDYSDDLDDNERTVAQAQRQREAMQSEYRHMLAERAFPPPSPATNLTHMMPGSLPPFGVAMGSPTAPSLTRHRVAPSPAPPMSQSSSTFAASIIMQAAGVVPVDSSPKVQTPITTSSKPPGTHATAADTFRTGGIATPTAAAAKPTFTINPTQGGSLPRNLTLSNNEDQDTTNPKSITPVTGLVQNVMAAGKPTKKRSSEDIHLNDDSDSDATVGGSSQPGSACTSPSKRRRVDVLEQSPAAKGVPMEEDYETAAENEDDIEETEDEQSTDEEDTPMAEDEDDDAEGETKMEES